MKSTLAVLVILTISSIVNVTAAQSPFFFAHLLLNSAIGCLLLARLSRPAINPAIFGISILVSLAVIESYFVFSGGDVLTDVEVIDGGPKYTRMDDRLGVVPNPGTYRVRRCRADCEADVIYDATYTIEQGGNRTTLTNGSHDQTVVFFGGSFTFGEGVSDHETMPYFFSLSNASTRVWNLGFQGYGPHQMLRWLDSGELSEVAGPQIDVMIFMSFPWHADRSYCIPHYSLGSPRYRLIDGKLESRGQCGLNSLLTKVVRRSKSYAWLRNTVLPQLMGVNEKFGLYLAILRESMRLAEEEYGSRFIVAFIDASDGYYSGSDYSNARLQASMREAGIEVVNVTMPSDGDGSDPSYVIQGDGHSTALAHRERASLIDDYLRKHEWRTPR